MPPVVLPIVPIVRAAGSAAVAPATPPGYVSFHGGPVLTSVRVFVIVWGTDVQWAQQDALTMDGPGGLLDYLNRIFDTVLTSPLIGALAEYSLPGQRIGPGVHGGPSWIKTYAGSLDDSVLRQQLETWIADPDIFVPPPNEDGQTVYFIYLPPGVEVTATFYPDKGQTRSCVNWCGYHWFIPSGTVPVRYAVVPWQGCPGCGFQPWVIDNLTVSSSHELFETITDPDACANLGWYDNGTGNEICDSCAGTTTQIGDFQVATVWSNAALRCVSSLAASAPRSDPFVFVAGTDGHLWLNYLWNATGWGWRDLGVPQMHGRVTTVAGGVGLCQADQRPYAFVAGADNHLWVCWWDGATWHWSDQGPPPSTGLAVTISGGMGACTMNDQPFAFIRDSAGHLSVNWWDGAHWFWSDQGMPETTTVAAGVGVCTVSERPYAFVQGADGHLWVNWWDGTVWHWSDQGVPAKPGFATVVVGGAGACTVDERPYAFVVGGDGDLWINWWDGTRWNWSAQGTQRTVVGGAGVCATQDPLGGPLNPCAFVTLNTGLTANRWNGNAWHWEPVNYSNAWHPGNAREDEFVSIASPIGAIAVVGAYGA